MSDVNVFELYTVFEKKCCNFIFITARVKNQSEWMLIIFSTQNLEETSHRKIVICLPHL